MHQSDYTVRFYDRNKDLEAAKSAGEDYCRKNDIEFEGKAFEAYIDMMEGRGAILVAADPDDNAAGFLCVVEVSNPFNGKRRLHQSDLYVREQDRGKGLVKLMHSRAKELGGLIGIEEYSWETP